MLLTRKDKLIANAAAINWKRAAERVEQEKFQFLVSLTRIQVASNCFHVLTTDYAVDRKPCDHLAVGCEWVRSRLEWQHGRCFMTFTCTNIYYVSSLQHENLFTGLAVMACLTSFFVIFLQAVFYSALSMCVFLYEDCLVCCLFAGTTKQIMLTDV